MSEIIVRFTNEADTEKLVALMCKAEECEEGWARQRLEEMGGILVAEEGNRLVGYIGIKLQNERLDLTPELSGFAHIIQLAVDPDQRRRGIASKLLQAAESWAREKEKPGIWIDCREELLALYEKEGFQVSRKYENNGSLRFVLAKVFG